MQNAHIFVEILIFQAVYNTKTIHSSFASWMHVEGRGHETQTQEDQGGASEHHFLNDPGADSFHQNGKLFLFAIDYCSRDVELPWSPIVTALRLVVMDNSPKSAAEGFANLNNLGDLNT